MKYSILIGKCTKQGCTAEGYIIKQKWNIAAPQKSPSFFLPMIIFLSPKGTYYPDLCGNYFLVFHYRFSVYSQILKHCGIVLKTF